MSYFNLRVYGFLINEHQQVLLSDEHFETRHFTKFPGGGVELGEGIADALKREFLEECELEIEVGAHVYTTDFYEKSSFNDSQIVSIYYIVHSQYDINIQKLNTIADAKQTFRWKTLSDLLLDDVTFRTDKVAIERLKSFCF